MRELFVIVVKTNTNPLLPEWLVGMPVRCATSGFTRSATFELASFTRMEAFGDRRDAELALIARRPSFDGIDFEIRRFAAV